MTRRGRPGPGPDWRAALLGAWILWAWSGGGLAVGEPTAGVAPALPALQARVTDREFAAGSRIEATVLTKQQIDRLALLGRVWGFIKYHHPRAAAGELLWDFELFRVVPAIRDAPDDAAARRRLCAWLDRVGPPPPCPGCAASPDSARPAPRIGWIHDRRGLGDGLRRRLERIYAHRRADGARAYTKLDRAGIADFSGEDPYPEFVTPDAGYRLLALFRLWNIVEYWSPHRDLLGPAWDAVLPEFIPRLLAASSSAAYRLELMALVARIEDTHAQLLDQDKAQPPAGDAYLPLAFRRVEEEFVVTETLASASPLAPPPRVGDLLRAIDGVSIDTLVARWRPYYGASNEPARLLELARSLGRGPRGPARLTVERSGTRLELVGARSIAAEEWPLRGTPAGLPGPTFQWLAPDVAYLDLGTASASDMADYLSRAADAQGLVLDLRCYPNEPIIPALGAHLVAEPTPYVMVTRPDLANPGAFFALPPFGLQPAAPRFTGRVAILVDASTMSAAEWTAMALRAAPGAIVVGSTTAGADGNTSIVALPGDCRVRLTGLGVYHADGRPTQRVGIVPDVEARPTVAGLCAGRDELVEAAARALTGREFVIRRR